MKMRFCALVIFSLLLSSFQGGLAEQCGTQAGGALCADGLCCSQYGYCGTTAEYCCTGCQSQCNADVCASGGGGGKGGHISSKIFQGGLAEQCGTQAGGALCADGLCCSQYGYCGTTAEYCCTGCQSQCNADVCAGGGGGGSGEGGHIGSIISSDDFDQLLPYRNDAACPAKNFYTYDAFIEAANSFPGFGTTGDTDIRKREIAAFLAQTSHETTGGWASAPGGPYSWGYCYVREINRGPYCEPNPNYPCASGQEYYGRGPIQLSWNYNYRQCGDYFKLDLLENPDLVATDPVISFKTAIWFWMTKQSPKPSCHEVITGTWNPTGVDIAAGRLPGYGTTTNIINGGLECGRGSNAQMEDRIGFYKRYCDILGVGYGDNLDCYSQSPFGNGLLVDTM